MVQIPTFHEERALMAQGVTLIAGVDEVGCGCWAGPVHAAAVILPLNSRLAIIRDSKLLSRAQRERWVEEIKKRSTAWAVGSASSEEVDKLNIRQAAFLAMQRALEALPLKPEFVLADGYQIPGLAVPCKRIVDGDTHVKSIAAASIIAKVTRDRLMEELDQRYPGYGFADHKGYGTKQHQAALAKLGPSPIHRMSYAPIRRFLPSSFVVE